MQQTIQFVATTPQDLQAQISAGIKFQLEEFLKHFTPIKHNEYVNRHQVAEMFGVHISTIALWQKNGTLNPLGLSGKVYFLRSEIEASLKPLNI